jgi:hypothetical protein
VSYRLTALIMGGLIIVLAACASVERSASPSDTTASAPSAASRSASSPASPSPSASPAALNPCDGVDVGAVSRALGARLRKETGTASSPRCALIPVQKGGPTFELSYLWFDQGLEAAWSTMKVPAGTVSRPAVAGADDARMVVNRSEAAYAVSAFLQNGKLIQTVNALALRPYDGPRVLRATHVLLGQLSAARG